MTQSSLSDVELLRLSAAGNEDAFGQLYDRHQGAVYRFALLMSGSAHVAEEVTQEVFLLLIREPDRYDPEQGPLQAYLYGVARNHVLRCLKRERAFVPLLDESDNGASAAEFIAHHDPYRDYSRNELIRLVRQAVLSLPPRYREVVVLCDFLEMSCGEASTVLGCAVGTVNSRLHRGHALLLRKLHAAGEVGAAAAAAERMRCFA
ncbi:MAG TPA: RNA polymerase sigma factor [Pyrinomonadaceae bacterium]|nr:RNA polymerase sigma factor [Pyrinomonadaceae bacterium]